MAGLLRQGICRFAATIVTIGSRWWGKGVGGGDWNVACNVGRLLEMCGWLILISDWMILDDHWLWFTHLPCVATTYICWGDLQKIWYTSIHGQNWKHYQHKFLPFSFAETAASARHPKMSPWHGLLSPNLKLTLQKKMWINILCLGGGFKHFLFSPLPVDFYLIWLLFFLWVELTTN